MSEKFNGVRIEFHILQSFPVSCLNRDDMGSPKSAIIGGVPRARVSSQCWKRAVRMKMHEMGVHTAFRTKKMKMICDKFTAQGVPFDLARECTLNIISALLKNEEKKTGKAPTADVEAQNVQNAEIPNEGNDEMKGDTLLFISDSEVSGLIEAFRKNNFKHLDAKTILSTCQTFFNPAHDGLDIALFGRMLANATDMNVEAAASFAHAISTHRVDPEIDFFTAVDDDDQAKNKQGSAHLGSLEFNSATYYRYISLDLGQLAKNLKTDDIVPAVEAFTHALFLAVPAARQTTMSAANPWNYAIVTVRKGQRMQLPFNTAVRTSAKEPDMVENSIVALQKKFADAERMYGSLFGLKSKTEISLESGSVDELTDNLKNALEAL